MIPNITRGGDTAGLMRYLVGQGRANEHENPHVVASSPLVGINASHDEELSLADARSIADQLDTYMMYYDVAPTGIVTNYNEDTGVLEYVKDMPNHVWHCSLSLSPDEEPLSDTQWNQIAKDFMDAMGFTSASGKADAPWVAINHGTSKNGGDHIHIVANIVRCDGTRVALFQDFKSAQKISLELERKHGLRVLESRVHGRGSRNDKAGELNQAKARGEEYTDRAKLEMIMRSCALQAESEADFVRLLRSKGVRAVPRYASGTTSVVTGFRVALHTENAVKPRWYAAGQVSRDLTLSRLRTKWEDTPLAAEEAVSAWNERSNIGHSKRPRTFTTNVGEQVRSLRELGAHIERINAHDPISLADASHNVSAVLSHLATNVSDPALARSLTLSARQVGRSAQLKVRANVPHVGSRALLNAGLHLATLPARRIDEYTIAREAIRLAIILARTYRLIQQVNTAHMIMRDTQSAHAQVKNAMSKVNERSLVASVSTTATHTAPAMKPAAPSANVPSDARSLTGFERSLRILQAQQKARSQGTRTSKPNPEVQLPPQQPNQQDNQRKL